MDEVRKVLSERFVAVQEKDVIADRFMDEYEISAIRENYGELAEGKIPDMEEKLEMLNAEYKSAKKDYESRLSALLTQFKDLVTLAKEGIKNYPLDMANTFRIPVSGHYLYYTWVDNSFKLALVQCIPNHEHGDLFNSGEQNKESFENMGYILPDVPINDTRVNLRRIDGVEVWEEDGYDVWVEQWIEDFSDEDTGEVVSIQRHKCHQVLIEESPWRKEGVDETGKQEGKTEQVSGESEE